MDFTSYTLVCGFRYFNTSYAHNIPLFNVCLEAILLNLLSIDLVLHGGHRTSHVLKLVIIPGYILYICVCVQRYKLGRPQSLSEIVFSIGTGQILWRIIFLSS